MEIFWGCFSAPRAGADFERREQGRQAGEYTRPQGEEVELALAPHIDQAGGFEFLDVVRERGCGDGQGRTGLRATEWTTGFCNALQQLEAPRISEGLEDSGAAGGAEMDWLCSFFRRFFRQGFGHFYPVYWM